MKNFKLTYSHEETCGKNLAVKIASAKFDAYACSCGHVENVKDISEVKECSKCNAKLFASIYTGYSYYNADGDQAKKIKIREGYYIDSMEFTKDGGFIDLKKIKVTYTYGLLELSGAPKKFHASHEELKECSIKEIKDEAMRIEMFYITNRNNKSTLKGFIRIGDKEYKILKSKISNIELLGCPQEATELLKNLCLSYEYNVLDMIWSVHNRYKHGKDLMDMGILKLTGSKEDIAKLSSIYNNEKLRPYFLKIQEQISNTSAYRMSDLLEYFKPENDKNQIPYVETRILINELKEQNIMRGRSYYTDSTLAEFILSADLNREDFISLIDLAQRQAFELLDSSKLHVFKSVAQTFKNYDIPFDKKPKELAIFYNKMSNLHYYLTDKYAIKNPLLLNDSPSTVTSLIEAIDDITQSKESNYLMSDDLLIKIAYHLRGSFKLLNELLYEIRMNDKKAGYLKINGEVIEDAIILYDKTNKEIKKVYLKDTTLDNKEDIENYLGDFKGEMVAC